jgi:hypothetical protein
VNTYAIVGSSTTFTNDAACVTARTNCKSGTGGFINTDQVVATPCYATYATFTSNLAPYMRKFPLDPSNGTTGNSGYYVGRDSNGYVVVGSCNSQGEGAGGALPGPIIQVAG